MSQAEGHPSEPELRARIAAGSRDATDYLALADLLKETSRFQEAAHIYEQALEIDLRNVDKARFAWELGSLIETGKMGRRADARSYADRALALLSDEGESRDVLLLRGLSQSLLAHAVWFEGPHAGAEAARLGVRWLEQVIRDYGHEDAVAIAYYELARLHNALGEPDKAIGFCRQYLRGELDKGERLAALMVLAEALESAGRMSEAESATREALGYAEEVKDALPNLYLTLALIQRAENRRIEARESLELALSALQDYPFPPADFELTRILYWRFAELHFEMGNFPEAASVLTKLLAEYAEDRHRQRALIWRAECYASMGQPEQARRDYEQILASAAASDEERATAREGLTELPPVTS